MRVRTAAEFDGRTGLHDADQLAVILTRHPNRAGLLRLFNGQHARDQMRVITNHLVYAPRDGALLLRAQSTSGPAKIKTHAIDSDPGTGLVDLLAEHVLERPLQKMRRCVVPADLSPPSLGNARTHSRAGRDLAFDHDAVMRDCFAHVLSIAYVEARAIAHDRTAVTDLTASLGVERRSIENEGPFLAGT